MRSKLNLASQTYINRQALYLFYAVCTALLILILVAQFRYLAQLQKQERLLSGHTAELKQELGMSADPTKGYSEEEFAQLLDEISFSNNLIRKDSFQWTELLGELESLLPADVRISDLRPDFKNSTLHISAQARTVEDLRSFLDRLNQSAAFTDVLLLSQAEQKQKGRGTTETLVLFNLNVKGVLQ